MPIKKKSDCCAALQQFCAEHGRPREILCDYSTEFQGPFKDYCIANGIYCRHSMPYSVFMQGLVERHNREVKNLARSLLIDSGLPPTFWAHTLKTAAYIKNRISTRNRPTLYKLLKSDKPDLLNMCIFRSPCYTFIEKDDCKPSDHKASACTSVPH